jgi:hypothetical protein
MIAAGRRRHIWVKGHDGGPDANRDGSGRTAHLSQRGSTSGHSRRPLGPSRSAREASQLTTPYEQWLARRRALGLATNRCVAKLGSRPAFVLARAWEAGAAS